MPPLKDRVAIRALLETDRGWAVYALGDLAPGHFEHTSWFAAPGGRPALALLYHAFSTPVLFALGEPRDVRPLLDEIGDLPQMYLHVRPDVVPLVAERHRVTREAPMRRMLLDPPGFRRADVAGVRQLGPGDLPALQQLHADGEAAGESPDFFAPGMLRDGTYFGVWEGGELIASAGTHLVNAAEGVAAIGNVYTRRDRRGRGLASGLTSAVAERLLRQGLRTVALNVNRHNAAAIRVYERLGFTHFCDFREGLAVRR